MSGRAHKKKYKCKPCNTFSGLRRGTSNLKAYFVARHGATKVAVTFGNHNSSSVIVSGPGRTGLQKMVTAKVVESSLPRLLSKDSAHK